MNRRAIIAGLALSLLACARFEEAPAPIYQTQELVFTAYVADEYDSTKTARQANTDVYWSPGDEISLFFRSGENGGSRFVAQNTEEVAITQFKGTIDVISGGGEDTGGEFWFWGIYPYSAENSCDGSSITTIIPAQQTGKAGTFADNTFITMARAKGLELGFYNICSGVKFTLSRNDIKEVRIRGNNNEDIAGKIKAEWDVNGKPVVAQYIEGAKEVSVAAPGGGTFAAGTEYYLVIAPTLFSDGFTMTLLTSDFKYGEFVYGSERQFKRSIFTTIPDLDTRVNSWAEPSKALLPYEFLPNGIDKTTITEVHFHVSNPTTTATIISAGDSEYEPIYFEKEGTVIHYYTVGKAFVPYSCFRFFNGWNSLETLDLSMWDTSNTISMREMFRDCYALRAVNLSSFDTESVNDMSLMFHNCWNLESIDLSSFNTSNVSNMSNMFSCFIEGGGVVSSALRQIDLSMFNTSNVTDVNQMFSGCRTLESINLTGWDTKNVEDMSGMFNECRSLKSIDLSSFDTGNVFGMSWMFAGCENLTELDLSNFNTSNVKYFTSMFSGCQSLTRLDISSFTLESMVRVDQMLHGCVKMLQLNMSAFDVPISFVETDFCTSLAGKSKSCAVKCCDSAKQLIQDNYDYKSNYYIWVALNDNFPANTEVRDPNLYYSSDYSRHQTIETLQTASYGNGINIAIMGDQYSDRLIADGTYKHDMQTAIEGVFELEPYKTYRNYFNIKIVYLVSDTEVCCSEGGSTALDVTNGMSNTIQANSYALSAFAGSTSQETSVIIICHDQHSFDGSGAMGYTFTQYLPENNSFANDYGQAAQAVCWIPVYDDEEVFKSTVSHEFGHCFAKLFDEYEVNTGTPDEAVINNQKQTMSLFGVGKNIDFTSDPYLIKWNNFLNDPRYVNSGIGIFEGGYIGSSGVWRPSDDSIMRSADYGTVFNAPSREAIYYRIHKLAFGESWEYDYEAFVQQDIKNVPQASPAPAKHTSSSVKVNRKHFFKMEESISEDGKKIITIIQN